MQPHEVAKEYNSSSKMFNYGKSLERTTACVSANEPDVLLALAGNSAPSSPVDPNLQSQLLQVLSGRRKGREVLLVKEGWARSSGQTGLPWSFWTRLEETSSSSAPSFNVWEFCHHQASLTLARCLTVPLCCDTYPPGDNADPMG